jgi:ribonuclease HI
MIKSIDQWIIKWLQNGWLTANGRTVKQRSKFRELLRLMENLQVKWVCTYLIIVDF